MKKHFILSVILSVISIEYSYSFSIQDTLNVLCTVKRIEKYHHNLNQMYVIIVETEDEEKYTVISYEGLQFDRTKIKEGYLYLFNLLFKKHELRFPDGRTISGPINYLDFWCYEDQIAGRELGRLYEATNLRGLYINSPPLFRTRKEARKYKKEHTLKAKIRQHPQHKHFQIR